MLPEYSNRERATASRNAAATPVDVLEFLCGTEEAIRLALGPEPRLKEAALVTRFNLALIGASALEGSCFRAPLCCARAFGRAEEFFWARYGTTKSPAFRKRRLRYALAESMASAMPLGKPRWASAPQGSIALRFAAREPSAKRKNSQSIRYGTAKAVPLQTRHLSGTSGLSDAAPIPSVPQWLRVENYRYAARRFCRATFAACLPSAVRVRLGRCAMVRFLLATAAAFLIFLRAAARCSGHRVAPFGLPEKVLRASAAPGEISLF